MSWVSFLLDNVPGLPARAAAPSRPARTDTAVGTRAVLIGATAIALALRLYLLFRPGYLFGVTGYDDGVDFGSAVRLVHGIIPYRDFALVQPPGISLLLAPVALLSNVTGTDTGLAVARILTVLVGTAGVTLVGLLIRHRGVLATTLACGIVAVNPDVILAGHSVLLEPWLVLLCLIGALLGFDRDQLTADPRRAVLAGVAFGFAGAIKTWAILPVMVLLVVYWRGRGGRFTSRYVAGVAAGFCLPVLPFAAIAPRAFWHSVIVAQLSRVDVERVSLVNRLISFTGLRDLSPGESVLLAVSLGVAALVVVNLAVAWWVAHRLPSPLEWFAFASALLVALAFLWPVDYYPHYDGFLAPFVALSVGLSVAGLSEALRRIDRRPARRRLIGLPLAGALTAIVVAGLAALALARLRHERVLSAGDPAAAAQREIPPGSCVLTDVSSLTLVAGRFTAKSAGCAPIVDAIGTDYALDDGRNATTGAGLNQAVDATWLGALEAAEFVWLDCAPPGASACQATTGRRIPWTAPLRAYFWRHFTPVRGELPHLYVRIRAS